ncbi:iron-sulfur cluster assembly scaffold protein [Planctomyces sp. SH-PL62]|uniref:iron-sulfur cluster assembly scaffold protein n=1 Tax=Planctomyces sp. SH-PL62 TaxID=1636152 RepID=UPI00078B4708|nr:iron-sulfur cluster assembly scaffold protein [Planctomyces sp. SH-PL62]AMV38347.1 NifU-like protein [Planctomyces sp. SH-PL62]
MDDPLYREEILDHYYSSPYRGRIEDPKGPNYVCDLDNPFCGDQIHVEMTVGADDRIREIRFDGKGCVISQAATSLLAEHLEGASVEDARKLGPADVVKLLGMSLTPTRMKCGLLGWKAIQQALQNKENATA